MYQNSKILYYCQIFNYWLGTQLDANGSSGSACSPIDWPQLLMIFFSILANCIAGQYPDPSNTDNCIPCNVGYYKPTAGAMLCTQCSPGFSTASTGSDSADLCHGMFIFLVTVFFAVYHTVLYACFYFYSFLRCWNVPRPEWHQQLHPLRCWILQGCIWRCSLYSVCCWLLYGNYRKQLRRPMLW